LINNIQHFGNDKEKILFTTPSHLLCSSYNKYCFTQTKPPHPSDATKVVNNKPALEKSEILIRIEDNKQSLKIITFNSKNCLTCGPFFNEAMQYMDVCLIQEHWLFNCPIDLLNEIHQNLIGIGKLVDDKDPI
jgi:hypothetical protein